MARLAKRILIGLTGLVAIAALAGATSESLIRRRVARDFPAPGRLVDIGGRRIQVDCRGNGSPTVVFEAGLDVFGSLAWSAVHDSIASTTRACAYSRAGTMWSDAAARPFTSEGVADDLHAVLASAGEQAPLVLVGHSIGGLYAMKYTERFGADVAGLVFVDASHPEQFARMEAATGVSLMPQPGQLRIGAAIAGTGLLRLLASGDLAPHGAPLIVHQAPSAYLPNSIAAALSELKALPATFSVAREIRQLGDRPLVVLTAMAPETAAALEAMHMSAAQGERKRAVWLALQHEEASWSTHSRHEVVPDASHYIQFDRPDVVIRAVREVVKSVRESNSTIISRNAP